MDTNIFINLSADRGITCVDDRFREVGEYVNKQVLFFHKIFKLLLWTIPISLAGIRFFPQGRYLFFAAAVTSLGVLIWFMIFRKNQRVIKLAYVLDEASEQLHQRLIFSVKSLLPSPYAEIVETTTEIARKKIQSNSVTTIHAHPFEVGKGKIFRRIYSNKKLPWMASRVNRCIFSPTHLLIVDKWQVQAYPYCDLAFDVSPKTLTMDHAPKHARVVNEPWKYINRDGSRDLRFKNNFRRKTFETTEFTIHRESEQLLRIISTKYGCFEKLEATLAELRKKTEIDKNCALEGVKRSTTMMEANSLRDVTPSSVNGRHSLPAKFLAGACSYNDSHDRIYFERLDIIGGRMIVDVTTDWGRYTRRSAERLTLLPEGELFAARRFRPYQGGEQSETCTLTLTARPIGNSLAIRGCWQELDELYEFEGLLDMQSG